MDGSFVLPFGSKFYVAAPKRGRTPDSCSLSDPDLWCGVDVEAGEDSSGGVVEGVCGGGGVVADSYGDFLEGTQGPHEVLDAHSGSGLKVACDGEGGDDDGQVCFDGVACVVEDRPGFEVGFAHAEGLLHMPQIVIRGDHLRGGHEAFGDVGDVALQSHEHSRPLNTLFVDAG